MIQSFCDWLAATSVSQLFSALGWFVPTVQTVHILAIAAVGTVLLMFNLRLLHLTRSGPEPAIMARNFLPWVWVALVVLLLTGILLTITEPARELMNDAFRIKMLLVGILVAVTLRLQRALLRGRTLPEAASELPRSGKALAVVSILLCVGIVVAGRLIAYS